MTRRGLGRKVALSVLLGGALLGARALLEPSSAAVFDAVAFAAPLCSSVVAAGEQALSKAAFIAPLWEPSPASPRPGPVLLAADRTAGDAAGPPGTAPAAAAETVRPGPGRPDAPLSEKAVAPEAAPIPPAIVPAQGASTRPAAVDTGQAPAAPRPAPAPADQPRTPSQASPAPAPGPIHEARVPRDDRIAEPVNIYAGTTAGHLSPAVADALPRVYVPDLNSSDVVVIDPATMTVVDRYRVGRSPQHVVPSWDLKTLWVTGSADGHAIWGSLTAIDARTGKPVGSYRMEDAYNMYFTQDGASAIVVAESRRRLEFRDPHTMTLQGQITIPACAGINHADFAPDGRYAIFTCEFSGALAKVDVVNRKLLGLLKLNGGGMPQDVRSSPDGTLFYVANMMTDGVHLIDGEAFKEVGFIPTGLGAHGLYPSRDGTKLYVANRGSHLVGGPPHGKGGVSVIDFATRAVVETWPVPGGGSPDMGNVSADGKQLWLSGRFDDVVYAFDTTSGAVTKIPVGRTPHGLTIWPQPGRYSLGHTGVMR